MTDTRTLFRRFRKESGLQQREIAEHLGMSQSTVSRFERMGPKHVMPQAAAALLDYMNGRTDRSASNGTGAPAKPTPKKHEVVLEFTLEEVVEMALELGATLHGDRILELPE